jgi:4'-phosphopantetheinyl transferase
MLLLYTKFDNPLDARSFQFYLDPLPDQFKQKASRFRRWCDAHTFVFGKLLMTEGIKILEGKSRQFWQHLKYSAHGKPLLDDLYFNISHTERIVVCVLSKTFPVGVDVEMINPSIDIEPYERIFRQQEWIEIKTSHDPIAEFYKRWTIKECVAKADGRGLSALSLLDCISDNQILVENTPWHFKSFKIFPEAQCAVASSVPVKTVEIRALNFERK